MIDDKPQLPKTAEDWKRAFPSIPTPSVWVPPKQTPADTEVVLVAYEKEDSEEHRNLDHEQECESWMPGGDCTCPRSWE